MMSIQLTEAGAEDQVPLPPVAIGSVPEEIATADQGLDQHRVDSVTAARTARS